MTRTLPSGTVTFLFSDVEGSTRLLDSLGSDRYAEALDAHHSVWRAALSRHGGVEVGTEGDSIFAAFPTASGALAAAREAQAELEGGPTKVRVGIHTGTPLVRDGGYVGIDVHRAARISAAGHGGQVLVSASTASLAGTDDLLDLGLHRLKDISAPERLYQLGAGRYPPLKTLDEQRVRVRRRRRRTMFLAGLAALCGGAALVLVLGPSDDPRLTSVERGSLGVIDPEGNRIVAQVPLGSSPRRLAFRSGTVWAGNGDDGTVSVVETDTRTLARTIKLDGYAGDVALDESEAWVASSDLFQQTLLARIDTDLGVQGDPVRVGASSRAGIDIFGERSDRLAIGAGSVWLTSAGRSSTAGSNVSSGGALMRLAPHTGRVVQRIGLGRVKELLVDSGSVWVTEVGAVTRIDLEGGTTDRITLGSAAVPNGIAVGENAIWIVSGPLVRATATGSRLVGGAAVTRIDPQTNAVVATIPIEGVPRGVAVTGSAVWVTERSKGRVIRIDPESNRVTAAIDLGNSPDDIVAADGHLWVAVP